MDAARQATADMDKWKNLAERAKRILSAGAKNELRRLEKEKEEADQKVYAMQKCIQIKDDAISQLRKENEGLLRKLKWRTDEISRLEKRISALEGDKGKPPQNGIIR